MASNAHVSQALLDLVEGGVGQEAFVVPGEFDGHLSQLGLKDLFAVPRAGEFFPGLRDGPSQLAILPLERPNPDDGA